jgi:hypothetical protein
LSISTYNIDVCKQLRGRVTDRKAAGFEGIKPHGIPVTWNPKITASQKCHASHLS